MAGAQLHVALRHRHLFHLVVCTFAREVVVPLEGGAELLREEFDRPCLSAEFLGVMTVVQQVFSLVGASCYNHWFSRWPTRRVVALGQSLLIAANLLDLVWVMRWNLQVGVSDKLMLLGEDTLTPMINGIAFLPMNILVIIPTTRFHPYI